MKRDAERDTEMVDRGEAHEIDTVAWALDRLGTWLRRVTPVSEWNTVALSSLDRLIRQGPQRVTDLVAAERISQPGMTGLIGRMEEAGLVTRGPDPRDGRATLVTATEAGVDYLGASTGSGPGPSSPGCSGCRPPTGRLSPRRLPPSTPCAICPLPREEYEHGRHRVPFRQPKAVFAVALACVVSFMGIGLVDPILPALAQKLDASPSQVELLFTSYLVITAVAMLVTGWVSSRIGAKRTLLIGLTLIVVFAGLAGASHTIGQIVGFRAGWGLGNALFIATSLAVIVSSAAGGFAGAIVLYETALGVGIASGPLLGGLLGSISWRGPFFGVCVLMSIALLATLILVPPTPRPASTSSIIEPLRALRHGDLARTSVTGLLYNWGFFTILGYAPFLMHLSRPQAGWGVLRLGRAGGALCGLRGTVVPGPVRDLVNPHRQPHLDQRAAARHRAVHVAPVGGHRGGDHVRSPDRPQQHPGDHRRHEHLAGGAGTWPRRRTDLCDSSAAAWPLTPPAAWPPATARTSRS